MLLLTTNLSEYVYYVIYASAGADPSAVQIRNGQDATGAAAVASGNEVSRASTGTQTFAADATGLTSGTSYKIAFVRSAGSGYSNVAVSSAFTTAASGVTAALTGQSIAVAQGSLSAALASQLSGQSVSLAQGAISAAVASPLTSQSVSLAQGSISAALAAPLTGQAVSLAQGTVAVESGVTAALTGQSVSIAQGSVSPVVSTALSGQSTTLTQGTLLAGVTPAITGQAVSLAQGSTVAAIAAPLTGQAVALAQGDVGIGGNIVRALTGQSLSLAQGAVSVLAASNTFSQEVVFRKFYMRKGKKLLMFDSVSEAEAYTKAEALADEAIAKANKTSRLARKRLRTRIVSPALPAHTIDTDWLAAMMERFAINLDLPALLAEQDYERVMQIHAMAMKMQDDDENDVELILQQENEMSQVLEGLKGLQNLVSKMSMSKRKRRVGEYER